MIGEMGLWDGQKFVRFSVMGEMYVALFVLHRFFVAIL